MYHRGKETCAIISTQVTYKTDHISLLQDSAMSSALKINHIRRKINGKI